MAFTSKIKRVVKLHYGDMIDMRVTSQSTESLTSSSDQQQSGEQNRAMAMYEDLIVAGNVIRDVIYSTRENVHIVHEVFRQVRKKLKTWRLLIEDFLLKTLETLIHVWQFTTILLLTILLLFCDKGLLLISNTITYFDNFYYCFYNTVHMQFTDILILLS